MAELAGPLHAGPHRQVQEHVLNSRQTICSDVSSETGNTLTDDRPYIYALCLV